LVSRYATSITGLSLLHASLSDQGCQRSRNEDALGFASRDRGEVTFLLVVADGVGGNAAGDIASHLAVDTVIQTFRDQPELTSVESFLRDSFQMANQRILQEATLHPERVGMATTCTVCALQGRQLVVGHVGDCRAYLLEDGALRQITHDHNMAADPVGEALYFMPDRPVLANVLTRWLGTEEELEVDIVGLAVPEESSILVCSDGLTKVVADGEILPWMSEKAPDQACRGLVDLALERGGPDNISVQIARLTRAS
jgi:serine/threonine protein phosphatase PrpC